MDKRFMYNVKIFIVYGILFEVMNALLTPYAAKFLMRIGGSDLDISIYNATKGFVMICAVLPGVFYINTKHNKQSSTARLVLAMACITLILIIVPYLPAPIQPISFIAISGFIMLPTSIYNASYQSFTGELFPMRRAQVIAKRSMYTILFTTTLTLVSGLIFKFWPKTNKEILTVYQVFFVLAFLSGLLGFHFFNKFDYTPIKKNTSLKFKESFKTIWHNKPFLNFIIASTVFHFGWQMGWPLFSIYMIKTLGADELWLAIINVGSATAMFFGHRKWPAIIDKYGHARISTICTLGMALTPLLYAFSPNLYILAVVSTITGLFTSGTITVLFADMLEVSPKNNRIIYIGFYNTLINITLTISPFVGHFFLKNFNIYIALIATTVFRLIGSFAFWLREKK